MTALFAFVGVVNADDIVGLKNIPTTPTAPADIATGYYLLKEVNAQQNSGVGGFMKASSESVGADVAPQGKDNALEVDKVDATYIWYVEKKDGGVYTISTANKKAAWQAPWQKEKNLVAVANKADLVFATTATVGDQSITADEGSFVVQNAEKNALVHYSGGKLGSWTDANPKSVMMFEAYLIPEDDLKTASICTVTYEYYFGDKKIDSKEKTHLVGDAFDAPAIPFLTFSYPQGAVTGTSTVRVNCTENLPFAVTTDLKNPVWQVVEMHRYSTFRVWKYEADGTVVVENHLSDKEATVSDNMLWCFVGNVVDGFSIYNKAAGMEKTLNATATNASVGVAADGNNVWKLAKSTATNEPAVCFTNNGSSYMNQNGGKIAYYGDADNGSTCYFFTPADIVIAEANKLAEEKDTPEGVFSKYAISEEVMTALNTGKQALETDKADVAKCQEFAAVVSGVKASGKEVPAGYYYIKAAGKGNNATWYVTHDVNNFVAKALGDTEELGAKHVWRFESVEGEAGFKLRSMELKKYVNPLKAAAPVTEITSDYEGGAKYTFTYNGKGQYIIKDGNNKVMRTEGNGDINYWDSESDETWQLISVDELYNISDIAATFTTQAEAFAALGEDEAMEALQMQKNRWTGVKDFNDEILDKINNDELVLKGDVEYAIEDMKLATDMIKPVLAYYNETYKPTLAYAEAILAKYEEGSDEYKSLAPVIEASKELTSVFGVSSLEYMVADLKANEVYALYDIDAPIETGETGWVDITRVEVGYPVIDNPAFETLDYWVINQEIINGEESEDFADEDAYNQHDAEWSVLEILPAVDDMTGKKAVVNIKQYANFVEGGTYRLSGKAYHKGATNAVFFVGDTKVVIPEEEWITFDNAVDKFWDNYTVEIEFEAQDYDYLALGYSCEFENADAALYVSDLKLEKIGASTYTLRERFQEVYQGDMMQGVTGFSMLKVFEPYCFLEAMHPAYDVLFAEVDTIYGAMWEGVPTDTATVAKAIRSMEAMKADFDTVANYLMTEEYWNATQEALTVIEGFMEESSVYAQLMDAYNAAMGVVYYEEEVDGEIEVMAKYYAAFTSVADIEAALEALANALEAAEAKIPTEITLDKEEAKLNLDMLTVQLVATVVGAETAEQTVYWESSDEEVATVDENGLVTAVGEGTAYITAYSIYKDVNAECVVYVDDLTIYPTGVTLNLSVDTLTTAGATVQLEATVAPEDAEDKTITWTTSDEKVATVDADGKVTAVANGTAVITATAANGKTATCTIVVAIPEDEDNGIESIEVEGNAVIYDIHGRRVEKMEKGFYIVNGKNVLVK